MERPPNPVPDLARIQPGLNPRFREFITNSARGPNEIQRGLNLDLTWTIWIDGTTWYNMTLAEFNSIFFENFYDYKII